MGHGALWPLSRRHLPSLPFLLLLLLLPDPRACDPDPAAAAATATVGDVLKDLLPRWPGLKEPGLLVEDLKAADPYRNLTHHHNLAPAESVPGRVAFHLAITSCSYRKGWASGLQATLASAWASGVHPASTTIIWCRPYNASAQPSFFANIRHSKLIKVLYMPRSLYAWIHASTHPVPAANQAAYMMALNVPAYYGAPEIPLLVTEDDIVFAPNFNARVARVMEQAREQNLGQSPAYIVAMYKGIRPVLPADQARTKYASFPDSRFADPGLDKQALNYGYMWGAQAVLFSSAVVPAVRAHFAEVMRGHSNEFQDFVLRGFLFNRFHCKASTTAVRHPLAAAARRLLRGLVTDGSPVAHDWSQAGGMDSGVGLPRQLRQQQGGAAANPTKGHPRCAIFTTDPSLVEHVGLRSAVFGAGGEKNERFHFADAGVFKAAFQVNDPEGTW